MLYDLGQEQTIPWNMNLVEGSPKLEALHSLITWSFMIRIRLVHNSYGIDTGIDQAGPKFGNRFLHRFHLLAAP